MDINEIFQILHRCDMKLLERRRQRKDAVANQVVRRQRAKPEVQKDNHPNYTKLKTQYKTTEKNQRKKENLT